ncbi:MAG: hypothetical protein WKG01_21905 [Kofleriaceae bacterium]
MNFIATATKIHLISIDDTTLDVTAQFNPKELQIDQNVPWKKPDAATQAGTQAGGAGKAKGPDENHMALEFTGAEGRTMSVELLFDGVEGGERSVKVQDQIEMLLTMARVMEPESQEETKRRPHHIKVIWGNSMFKGSDNKFMCVIEGLSTKYSMFAADGTPTRATCTVKLKEAARVDKKKK